MFGKNRFRFVGAVLAACVLMLTGALAGCNKKTKYDFTVWVIQNDDVGNYKNADVFKKMEEITGKKVNFVMGTDIQLMFATRDYPEAVVTVLGDDAGYPGGIDKGISDKVLLDLTDLIEEHAPNYKAFVNSDPAIKREVITDNGRIGAMYAVSEDTQGPWYGYVMRKDLLIKYADSFTFPYNEELGCKIPITYADWTQVLIKVSRPKDKGGEGMTNPIYLSQTGIDLFNILNGGFGVTGDFYNENGVVKYGPIEQGFKDYLHQMYEWCSMGNLIPKDFNTNTSLFVPSLQDIIGNKKTEPIVMAFPYIYTMIDSVDQQGRNAGIENFELVPVPSPRVNASDDLHIRQTNLRIGAHVLLTEKCKNPAEIVEWFDYFYSDAGRLLMNYGTEGKSYNMVDGKPVFTQLVRDEFDSGAFYKYASHAFPTVSDWRREFQLISSKAIQAMDVWATKNDGSYLLSLAITMTPAEGARYSTLMVDINTKLGEKVAQFIKGEYAFTNFNNFVQDLKGMGIEEAIAIKQAGLDRLNNRQV